MSTLHLRRRLNAYVSHSKSNSALLPTVTSWCKFRDIEWLLCTVAIGCCVPNIQTIEQSEQLDNVGG